MIKMIVMIAITEKGNYTNSNKGKNNTNNCNDANGNIEKKMFI